MTQKSEAEQEVKGEIATQMRKLISPFFQQAVEGALATQDVEAFWEEVEAAIFHGMAKYTLKLAEEAEQEAAETVKGIQVGERAPIHIQHEHGFLTQVAAWLREKAR